MVGQTLRKCYIRSRNSLAGSPSWAVRRLASHTWPQSVAAHAWDRRSHTDDSRYRQWRNVQYSPRRRHNRAAYYLLRGANATAHLDPRTGMTLLPSAGAVQSTEALRLLRAIRPGIFAATDQAALVQYWQRPADTPSEAFGQTLRQSKQATQREASTALFGISRQPPRQTRSQRLHAIQVAEFSLIWKNENGTAAPTASRPDRGCYNICLAPPHPPAPRAVRNRWTSV